ncbi:response regulator transcription factor [Cytobacillus sp. T106]|nr:MULTISPECIES: response regulator transcription factor [Bacillus]MCK6206768.1 response regulator transcription factor [Bacillus infantis]MCP1160868.1 response regulator transcription factor [Bacillus infantis]MDT0161436.1 response regulator transcription factor [Bacillus sp. AG4(2022)]MDW2876277.1 response regulator transcription factor [Bacillus infantis]
MKNILYIEDDKEIGKWTKDYLLEKGYSVDWLQSGEGAAQAAARADLVILDVMLPGLDGFTVGQRLKKDAPGIPILMLSARTAVDDKLQGLQFADDYLTKPFHPEELAARVDVLLRRYGKPEQSRLLLRHLEVSLGENRITDTRSGEEIILTGKQHQIFMYMLRHPNQILTKEQIFEAVWGEPYMDGDKTLMVHIRYLREKIEENPGSPAILETIRGIGYRVKQ